MKKVLIFACIVSLGLLHAGIALADDVNSKKVTDPAFDKYVDAELMDAAVQAADPALMTDIALQLAEGERILLRSHKGISSGDMMKAAAKLAAVKGDKATEARLKNVAEKLGKSELVAELASFAKLDGASRSAVPVPKFSTNDDKEAEETVKEIIKAIEEACLIQNVSELDEIEKTVLGGKILPENVTKEIAEYVAKVKASFSEESDPTLTKLTGVSRQFGGGQNYPNTVKPKQLQFDPNATPDPCSPANAGAYGIACAPIEDPNAQGSMGGRPYPSRKLNAEFVVVPSGGRCITRLFPWSPLRRAGLEVGDIIIRMDGIPVNSDWELENHYSWTVIDLIDVRTGRIVRRNVFIP